MKNSVVKEAKPVLGDDILSGKGLENSSCVVDPYADPYGDSTGWTRRFVADYDLRIFREKGQKALLPQRKIPILAAHNPEVVGSSPASATIKSTGF